MEEIIDSRYYYGRLQYKTKWAGYNVDNTWYNADLFENSPELVQAFHEKMGDRRPKPRPNGLRAGTRRR